MEETIVKSSADLEAVRVKGERTKSMGISNLNDHSSRSHSLFQVTIESAGSIGEDDDGGGGGGGGGDGVGGVSGEGEAHTGGVAEEGGGGEAKSGGPEEDQPASSASSVSSASASTSTAASSSKAVATSNGKAAASSVRVSLLNFVDLAGSESMMSTKGGVSKQQEETKAINKSLR